MIQKDFIEKLIKKIVEYQKIAIFCHHQPDYDAYGSAYALTQWIQDNFKNEKQVFLMVPSKILNANEQILFADPNGLPSEEILHGSLGIILDTANEARILTSMHVHCHELINIDHHPKSETFAQLEFVDPLYPATAQILAEIFEAVEDKYLYTSVVAQYLYAGIITDTNNLLSPTVLPTTFEIVGRLISKGINRLLVMDAIFLQTLLQKQFNAYILKQIRILNGSLAYAMIARRASINYKMENIPSMVQVLANITNVEVWTTINYDFQSKKWKTSIRSRNLEVNNIAREFGGGGHKTIAATTFSRKWDYYKLLARLEQYLVMMGYAQTLNKDNLTKFSFSNFIVKFYRLTKYK